VHRQRYPAAWLRPLLVEIDGSDVGQVAALFVVIQAVAHHEIIGDGEAQVIDGDVHLVPLGLVQQGAHLQAARLAVQQQLTHGADGVTRVDDVVDQDHVPAADVGLVVRVDAHEAARFGFVIGGDRHEVHGDGALDVAHQVGEEDHAAAQQAQQQYSFRILVVARDRLAQHLDALLDIGLRDDDALDEIIGEGTLIIQWSCPKR